MSDRPVRALPHFYLLLSPGSMDILIKFQGDVKYAKKLDKPQVEGNIPDDLRRNVCSKSESKGSPLIW